MAVSLQPPVTDPESQQLLSWGRADTEPQLCGHTALRSLDTSPLSIQDTGEGQVSTLVPILRVESEGKAHAPFKVADVQSVWQTHPSSLPGERPRGRGNGLAENENDKERPQGPAARTARMATGGPEVGGPDGL